MQVRNRVIVVTGGGSGIGRALVRELLSRGASVAAVDIDAPALQLTLEIAGDQADRLSTHVVDITDEQSVAQLPGQVIARHGAVDGLINNAGIIQPFVRVPDLDQRAIDRVMDVNFFGTLSMTRAFLPHLLRRPEAHLVNVSSMGGFLPVPGQSIYGASKAAVKLFTEGLRSELRGTPVHVTLVLPGAVATDIAENSGADLSVESAGGGLLSLMKPLDPARAAGQIVDAMERNRFRVLVGRDARMMDLLYRLSPKLAADLIYRFMRSLLPE